MAHTHTTVLQLFWILSETTWMSRYQKGKTRKTNQSGFTGARDSEWQWHLLGRMAICTLPEADNHANIPSLSFYRPDALPLPNQQCQSTEDTYVWQWHVLQKITGLSTTDTLNPQVSNELYLSLLSEVLLVTVNNN